MLRHALAMLVLLFAAPLAGCAKDFCTQALETDADVLAKMGSCPYFERKPEPLTLERCSPLLELCTQEDLALLLEQYVCLDAVAECEPGLEYEFTYAVNDCRKSRSKLTKQCLDAVTR
jgi:hypothetical protein